MESYLKGRGFKDDLNKDSMFESLLDSSKKSSDTPHPDPVEANPPQKEVIYDAENCPKVEVVSVDGKPTSIVIHLQDGRLLEIDCVY
jgi:hypothetical protein